MEALLIDTSELLHYSRLGGVGRGLPEDAVITRPSISDDMDLLLDGAIAAALLEPMAKIPLVPTTDEELPELVSVTAGRGLTKECVAKLGADEAVSAVWKLDASPFGSSSSTVFIERQCSKSSVESASSAMEAAASGADWETAFRLSTESALSCKPRMPQRPACPRTRTSATRPTSRARRLRAATSRELASIGLGTIGV